MYKKVLPIILIFSIFLFSCGSKPAPAPEERPVEKAEKQDQVSDDGLNRAKEAAEKARQQALDVEGDKTFPDDWQKAESVFTDANNAPRDTQKNVDAAIAQYKTALDAYNALFQKALPGYVSKRAQELADARQAALDAGIEYLAPDYLSLADKTAEKAGQQYENREYYPASDTAHNALLLYRALKTGVDAYNKRQQIIDHDLIAYVQDDFDDIDALVADAAADYEAGNGKDAFDKIEKVSNRYTVCLATAWKAGVAEERQNALDVKADVAVRDIFREADALHNQGGIAFQAEKFEDASDAFSQAQDLFKRAGAVAQEKRVTADAAIKAAEEKAIESEAIARNASVILEGDAE